MGSELVGSELVGSELVEKMKQLTHFWKIYSCLGTAAPFDGGLAEMLENLSSEQRPY